jgi:hypothetical protein
MGIIKIYHDKKWTLQFLDALYNSIDIILDLTHNEMLQKLCLCQPIQLHVFRTF